MCALILCRLHSCTRLYENIWKVDCIAYHLDRLPLPPFPLLENVTQARKWKVKGKYYSLVSHQVKQSTPSDDALLRRRIDSSKPARVLNMDGTEERVENN